MSATLHWDDVDGVPTSTEHPEPVVRATEVGVDDACVPLAARRIVAVAVKAGWECSVHHAHGNTLTGIRASVGQLTHSVVVRMRHGERSAVAWWHGRNVDNYKFIGAYGTMGPFTTAKRLSAAQLSGFVKLAP